MKIDGKYCSTLHFIIENCKYALVHACTCWLTNICVTLGQVPSIGRCDFETDNCGWINIPGSHGWEKNQGTTKTNKTGPKADHTLRSEFGKCIINMIRGLQLCKSNMVY